MFATSIPLNLPVLAVTILYWGRGALEASKTPGHHQAQKGRPLGLCYLSELLPSAYPLSGTVCFSKNHAVSNNKCESSCIREENPQKLNSESISYK